MGVLGTFVRRREPRRDKETYEEVSYRFPVAVAPQLPPEPPIYSLTPDTRRAKMPTVYFFHPGADEWEAQAFTGRLRATRRATVPAGQQAAWGARFNIRRPIPGTFGEQFELGGE